MLISTCVDLLEDRAPEEVTIEAVLDQAGVTKGALYHHFADFAELVEAGLVVRFSRFVDESITDLTAMTDVGSREELLAGMAAVTAVTQDPNRKHIRFARAHVLTLASSNPRLAATLAAEQLRLTEALTDLIRTAQSKGWFNSEFDARAGAVLIQAYTLGRIVDDITTDPVDAAEWERLIMRLIERVLA